LQFPNINPVAVAIGPLSIRWYALAYLGGVALGALYGRQLLARRSLWPGNSPPFEPPAIYDFAFWAVLGIVVGGRIGYVLFYNLPLYLAHPLDAFAIWDGGMSFHGGLVGILLAVVAFTRSKGGRILSAMDLLSAIVPIGLLLGRIANFINGELYGRETDLPWGVVFPGGGPLPRHPSQLYEGGLEGLGLFLALLLVIRAGGLKRPGLVAGLFGMGYGISRILVEFVRIPDVQLGYLAGGWLTMGQLLSMPVLLAGLIFVIRALWRPLG
jgi:phosphatidylglycerol:prolipoprotein diacylglycerol transferase